MSLALIPQPKKIQAGAGCFVLPASGSIGIADGALYAVAQQAFGLFKRASVHMAIRQAADTLILRLAPFRDSSMYRLVISSRGIVIEGGSVAAVFWGLQTLRQIAAQCPGGRLTALEITDWPDFENRGLCYDVCRGRVPRLERLMELADQMARYKMNQLQLYIEHTFAFHGHPDIGKGASPLTAGDILRLDAYCRERHVELVPMLASFGHLHTVLQHPRYRHLSEDLGINKYEDPNTPKGLRHNSGMRAFTLSPAQPEVYRFLDSLFSEFLPLFSSQRFNVCCDETWDLGYGQSYKLCKKIGRGRLYLGHIIRLNALCRKYGKRIMFWGDIIRQHPELIPQIPREVTVLDWGYSHDHPFERIRDFKKAGLDFYACPSTSSYVSLFPRIPEAMANIAGFADAARRHGAQGILNTDWGDGGHYNFLELSWHGFLFGAEQSWNTGADARTFTERFCRLFLKTHDPAMIRALADLGDIAHLGMAGFYQSMWRHIFFATSGVLPREARDGWVSKKGRISKVKLRLTASLGRQTLARLDRIRRVFATHASNRKEDPLKVLSYWLFAVDTLRHAARKLAVMGPGGTGTVAGRKALQHELAALKRRFKRLWLAHNRPSEIRITLKAYDRASRAIGEGRIFR